MYESRSSQLQLQTQLLQLRKERLKKIQACMGFERLDLCDTGAALLPSNKPTGSRSLNWLNPL